MRLNGTTSNFRNEYIPVNIRDPPGMVEHTGGKDGVPTRILNLESHPDPTTWKPSRQLMSRQVLDMYWDEQSIILPFNFTNFGCRRFMLQQRSRGGNRGVKCCLAGKCL